MQSYYLSAICVTPTQACGIRNYALHSREWKTVCRRRSRGLSRRGYCFDREQCSKLNPVANTVCSAGEALQFLPDIFPVHIENLPDYQEIYRLLRKSQYGVRFYDKGLYDEVKELFQEMDLLKHTNRLITILRILGRLTECRNIKLLSDVAYNGSNRLLEVNEPVNKVYTYLFNHFKEKVLLQEVADYVKQNPSALIQTCLFRK